MRGLWDVIKNSLGLSAPLYNEYTITAQDFIDGDFYTLIRNNPITVEYNVIRHQPDSKSSLVLISIQKLEFKDGEYWVLGQNQLGESVSFGTPKNIKLKVTALN